jgi:MFS family permease
VGRHAAARQRRRSYDGCVLASYRRFLAIPGALRLLVSAVATRMPTSMLSLSIVLLFHARTGSFALAGVAVGVFALSNAAMAPLQGILVDRLGQPRVLAVCALGQSAALLLLVLAVQADVPPAPTVAFVGVAGALVPPSMACVRALWPTITPDAATRDAAYALDAIIVELAWVLGPLIVVATVLLVSPSAAILACVAITLAGTATLASSPHARCWRPYHPHPRRPRAGAVASRPLRLLLLSIGLTGFWWGALQVGFPALAVHAGSRQAAGVMLGLVSVGGVLGGLVYGARRWHLSLDRRYPALLALMAVLLIPLTVAHSLAAGITLSVLAGLAMTPAISCQNTLVGAAAPADAMTEAFAWTTAATFAGIAAGSVAAGALVDVAGVGGPFASASAALAVAAAVAAASRGRRTTGGVARRTVVMARE